MAEMTLTGQGMMEGSVALAVLETRNRARAANAPSHSSCRQHLIQRQHAQQADDARQAFHHRPGTERVLAG